MQIIAVGTYSVLLEFAACKQLSSIAFEFFCLLRNRYDTYIVIYTHMCLTIQILVFAAFYHYDVLNTANSAAD